MPYKDLEKRKEYHKEYCREYRKRDYVKERRKKYREDNRLVIKNKNKEYNIKNKDRIREYSKSYRAKNINMIKKWSKDAYERTKDMTKEQRFLNARKFMLKKKFGLSIEEYEKMLSEQNNVCAICLTNTGKRRLAVDHCHKTGKIRGLLCSKCNTALGNMKDNIDTLKSAISYLERY